MPGAPEKRAPRPKIPWRRVDGVLLLDKPSGMSSNDALQKARRLFLAEKGTLSGEPLKHVVRTPDGTLRGY